MNSILIRKADITNLETDKLKIDGKEKDAVFFHLPTEPYGYMSNWYPAKFTWEGITFTSTEQYIMYRKCLSFGDDASAAAVLATDDPAKQQRIGRNASGFVSTIWDGMKQVLVFQGLMAKFSQNKDLKKKLLDTGDATSSSVPIKIESGPAAGASSMKRYMISVNGAGRTCWALL